MGKKYFGTDGVRGVANSELTAELAFKIGRYLGTAEKAEVYIGRDTRVSGEMLEAALTAGLLSSGAKVYQLGVISTPGVAYLTKKHKATYGIMISASHNPVQDNGIKIFQTSGYKLTDELELQIEAFIDGEDTLPRPTGVNVGHLEAYPQGVSEYEAYLKSAVSVSFDGLTVALDCAHGATSSVAKQLFDDLGANTLLIGAEPTGLNINDGVGSTHPEYLAKFVVENNADLGLSFDGDGDRLIAVDHLGNVVDGDYIMYILGKSLRDQGKLKDDVVVSTVMSNLGFYKAIENANMKSIPTAVGDRYVLEEMLKSGYSLGGEQSGHIILLEYSTTGDGMLSGIKLIEGLVNSGKSLYEAANELEKYPQLLRNLRVSSKDVVMTHPDVAVATKEVEDMMSGEGRVLVRPSGTEPLVRVMVEAKTEELCELYVDKIINVMKTVA
jgi:phosphoglucosamine mutase